MGEVFHESIRVPEGDKYLEALQKLHHQFPTSAIIRIIIPEGKILGQEPHHPYIFCVRGSQADIVFCHNTLDYLYEDQKI